MSTVLRFTCLLALSSGCYLSHELEGPAADAPTSDCPSAIQASPSPVAGYCPTLAHRSEREAPATAPQLAWELELPAEVDRFQHLVVANGGRLYVRGDSQLFAVDDRGGRGRLAWTADFDGRVSSPVLLPDGRIFVVVRMGLERSEGVWLDADGEVVRSATLPTGTSAAPIVGASGGFTFIARTPDFTSQLVGWDPASGTERWRSRTFATSSPTVALASADQLVVADRVLADDGRVPRLTGFDGLTGAELWSQLVGAPEESLARGPAVGPDGAIHAVLWTDEFATTTLLSLEPSGAERLRVTLPSEPWGGGVGSLTIGGDGRLFVKEGEKLMGVEPDGTVAWELPVHPNIGAGQTVDAVGRLLGGNGGSSAIDGADGRELWVSEIPAHREETPGGGVSFSFPGPPTVGDGALYYLASDRILQAAKAPPEP